MSVTLVTYCCPKDIHKTYAGFGVLVDSHKYPFDEVILVRQRCRDVDAGTLNRPCRVLETEDYPWDSIYSKFNIPLDDPDADFHTKGTRYYWRYHCWNQLIALLETRTDYIAFTDCDCVMDGDPPGNSWVARGVRVLQLDRSVFMVSPNQRQATKGDFKTQAISQIVFLCERQRFLDIDYEIPVPPGVNRREYWGTFHYVFEGRLSRYAKIHNLHRMILAGPPWVIHHAW